MGANARTVAFTNLVCCGVLVVATSCNRSCKRSVCDDPKFVHVDPGGYVPVAPPHEPSGYEVIIDGERGLYPIHRLRGSLGATSVGDVLFARHWCMTLDDSGTYDLRDDLDGNGVVLRMSQDGSSVVVELSGDPLKSNPLSEMTAAELEQVRGVVIGEWTDGTAEALDKLRLDKTCVYVKSSAGVGKNGRELADLPGSTRYLVLDVGSSDGLRDLSSLRNASSLVYLHFSGPSGWTVDVENIAGAHELRYLGIENSSIKNSRALTGLGELRRISFRGNEGIDDISFVEKLTKLEEIDLWYTGVADLSPLSNNPNLMKVVADESPVTRLPKDVAGLAWLSVMSTRLSDSDVERFRKEVPGCYIRHRWIHALLDVIHASDEMVVSNWSSEGWKPVFEVMEKKEIEQLASMIDLYETDICNHCMCVGTPMLSFYDSGELLAEITLHHGARIRYVWLGDAELTDESSRAIAEWLASRGIDYVLEEIEDDKE
jgi:hypothetical protein